ncbi:helix-turn-helix domain-containing protein [Psychrobacter glacincola]|uniref:helix-turn-helix domain-containing protein n=1 Tax=Psychrobacter glacincola TaxID=56810 RepID=UPI003D09528F
MLRFEYYPLFRQLERLPDGSWHSEDIKSAIRKRGVTLADLCALMGVDKRAASKALAKPFTKGELAIAQYLNVPVQLLFPTRWTVEKKRVRPRYADKYTTVAELLS